MFLISKNFFSGPSSISKMEKLVVRDVSQLKVFMVVNKTLGVSDESTVLPLDYDRSTGQVVSFYYVESVTTVFGDYPLSEGRIFNGPKKRIEQGFLTPSSIPDLFMSFSTSPPIPPLQTSQVNQCLFIDHVGDLVCSDMDFCSHGWGIIR